MTSRRVLEREKTDKRRQSRPDPDLGFRVSLSRWAMAYGHSSGLPPVEAPNMIAEKHKLAREPAVKNVSSAKFACSARRPVTLTGVTVQVRMHHMQCKKRTVRYGTEVVIRLESSR